MFLKVFSKIPLSSIDCRTDMCTVYFLSGCNLKCPYCQNYPAWTRGDLLDLEDLRKEVESNWAAGIVKFTGGEPTLQLKPLLGACEIINSLGKRVAFDTNGMNPKAVRMLCRYNPVEAAVDYKATAPKYEKVTGKPVHEHVLDTIRVLKEASINFEVRTTFVPPLLNLDDLREMARTLKILNIPYWKLQRFEPTQNTPKWLEFPTLRKVKEIADTLRKEFGMKIDVS